MGLRIRAVGRSAEDARRKEAERGRGGGGKMGYVYGVPYRTKGEEGWERETA